MYPINHADGYSTHSMLMNRIKVKIYSTFVNSLIDTGSSYSVCSEWLIKRLRLPVEKIDSGDPEVLYGAEGAQIPITGKTVIPVKLNGLIVPFDFLIAGKLTQNLILGHNFLIHTKALINYNDSSITFFDNLVEMCLFNKRRDVIACIDNSYDLEPRTESLVNVTISQPLHGSCFLLQPLSMREKQKYLVANILTKISNGKTVCRILNATHQVIHLKKNLPLAKVSEINPASISHFDQFDGPTHPQINTLDSSFIPHSSRPHSQNRNQSETCFKNNHNQTPTQIPFVQGKFRTLDELGIKLNNQNLNSGQREQLKKLIEENSDVFALSLHDIPGTNLVHYDIDTGNHRPIRQRPYRPNPQGREEMTRQIQGLLDAGFITQSTSAWSSPCILVKKKNGEQRFVTDYRMLNRVSVPLNWPLPLLTDVLDSLSANKSSYFSSLDLKQGYHQVPLTKNAQEKSAFCTPDGTYKWNRLAFGLQGAGQVFQMLMSEVLRGLTFKTLIVYVDDILIFSPTFEKHLEDLRQVFHRLRQASLRLHPSKCSFATPETLYLGHKISAQGIRVDESKIELIKNWPTPKNVKDTRSFLGFTNYYRRFLKDYAKIATPLNELLRKDTNFEWTNERQQAFDTLRDGMSTTPILIYVDVNKPFLLTTDASMTSIAYVLSQLDENGVERPISFGGRSLRSNEKNWAIMEIEGLALIEGIRENYAYLQSQRFEVITDHLSLKYLQTLKHSQGRLFRWSLILQNLRFTVKHRPGRTNVNADILSRRNYGPPPPLTEACDEIVNDNIQIASISDSNVLAMSEDEYTSHYRSENNSPAIAYFNSNRVHENTVMLLTENEKDDANALFPVENLAQLQKECDDLKRLILYLETGDLPDNEKLARKTIYESENYFLDNDILIHMVNRKQKRKNLQYPTNEQVAVPESLRVKIVKFYHEAGHKNFDRTYQSIKEKYYWSSIYTDTRKQVRACEFCQRTNPATHVKRAPLKPWEIGKVWDRIHCDILGPLPSGSHTYKYALLLVDSFSRWAELFPLKSLQAEETAEIIFDVICRNGIFNSLVTDRGTTFLSGIMNRLCELCHIRRVKSLSYHPQTNGAAEQFNRFVWKNLKAYCQKDNTSWPKYLSTICCSHRSTVSIYSTGFTPFSMFTGRTMNLPLDEMIAFTPTEGSTDANSYMRSLEDRIKIMHEIATANVQEAQERMKTSYDKKATKVVYPVGMKLWVYKPSQLPVGSSKKMQIKYNQLVRIKEKIGDNSYIVIDDQTGKEIKFPIHVDNFREYYPRDIDISLDDNADMTKDEDDSCIIRSLPPDAPVSTKTNTKLKHAGKSNLTDSDLIGDSKAPKPNDPTIPTKGRVIVKKLGFPLVGVRPNETNVLPTDRQLTGPQSNEPNGRPKCQEKNDEKKTSNKVKMKGFCKLNDQWYKADRIVKSDIKKGRKSYLIEWSDRTLPSSWVEDEDVSEDLKDLFDTNFRPSGRPIRKCIRQKYI